MKNPWEEIDLNAYENHMSLNERPRYCGSFFRNATDLTPVIREKQVKLFTDCHASVRIIHLETEWEEQLRRNRERNEAIPDMVTRDMTRSMVLPEQFEAQGVEWRCV